MQEGPPFAHTNPNQTDPRQEDLLKKIEHKKARIQELEKYLSGLSQEFESVREARKIIQEEIRKNPSDTKAVEESEQLRQRLVFEIPPRHNTTSDSVKRERRELEELEAEASSIQAEQKMHDTASEVVDEKPNTEVDRQEKAVPVEEIKIAQEKSSERQALENITEPTQKTQVKQSVNQSEVVPKPEEHVPENSTETAPVSPTQSPENQPSQEHTEAHKSEFQVARERYRSVREEMLVARQEWERSLSQLYDIKQTGVIERFFDSKPFEEEAKTKRQEYLQLLERLRSEREQRMGAFMKERITQDVYPGNADVENAVPELIGSEKTIRYAAFHEALLDRRIDTDVILCERNGAPEKKPESSRRLLEKVKGVGRWYAALPLKKKVIWGAAVGFGVGAVSAVGTGSLIFAGGLGVTAAARRASGVLFSSTVGGSIAGAVKGFADRQAEKFTQGRIQKTKDEFQGTELKDTLEQRLKIRKTGQNIRTAGTISATGAAVGSAWVVGAGVAHALDSLQDTMPSALSGAHIETPSVADVTQSVVEEVVTDVPPEVPSPVADVHEFADTADVAKSAVEETVKETLPETPSPVAEMHGDAIPDALSGTHIETPSAADVTQSAVEEVVTDVSPEASSPVADVHEFAGTYEDGSSIERELQQFLKSNTWVKEHYTNLSDDDMGRVAHRMRLALADDSEMENALRVRGGQWDNVRAGDAYKTTIQHNVLERELAAVGGGHESVTDAVSSVETATSNNESLTNVPVETFADAHTESHITVPEQGASSVEVTNDDMPTLTDKVIAQEALHAKEHASDPVALRPTEYTSDTTAVEYAAAREGIRTEDFPNMWKEFEHVDTTNIESINEMRKSLERLFTRDHLFDRMLSGQYDKIRSHWGVISRVDVNDVFDGDKKLTLDMGHGAPITMGSDAERLVRSIIGQIEHRGTAHIPDMQDIIEYARDNHWSTGRFVEEIDRRMRLARAIGNPSPAATLAQLDPSETTGRNFSQVATDVPRPTRTAPLVGIETSPIVESNTVTAGGRVGLRVGGGESIRDIDVRMNDEISPRAAWMIRDQLNAHPSWTSTSAQELLENGDSEFAKLWRRYVGNEEGYYGSVAQEGKGRIPAYRARLDPQDIEKLKTMNGSEALIQLEDQRLDYHERYMRHGSDTLYRDRGKLFKR